MLRAIAAALLAAIVLSAPSAQAAYPERTVTIVTPFAPGGIADVVARLTAERLQSALKQNFVVENVSGAGGTAGPERVSKAAPDGYTLMSTPIFQLTTAKYAQNVSFDENTFKPISGVASAPFAITVNASFPGNTLADFIAHVKANQGKLSFGSAGAGSTTHVAAVMVLKAAGLDMVHVPYRGVAPAFTDLLAGHVLMVAGFAGRAEAVPEVRQAQGAGAARHQAFAVPAGRAAGDRNAEGLPAGGDLQRAAWSQGYPSGGRRYALARAGRGPPVRRSSRSGFRTSACNHC